MYIFISYSSKDKVFVRQLVQSLMFYGVPIFLDEREIKVGENIPDRVFDAIDRATHVICVLSAHSAKSIWVKEELSAAKMRQLSDVGCQILPILIDDVSIPATIFHIKHGNFRSWMVKEAYLESLQELLFALGLKAQYSTADELRICRIHLSRLVSINEFAAGCAQLYFQLERLWFYLFNRQPQAASHWCSETFRKALDAVGMKEACDALARGSKDLHAESNRIGQLLESANAMLEDVSFWEGELDVNDSDTTYKRIWQSEKRSHEVSAQTVAIILEIEKANAT